MRELNTIQKVEKLNKVFVMDEVGAGGANHKYVIKDATGDNDIEHVISFQHGPRKEKDSTHGVLDTDLLEIVRDRLRGFQTGDFATSDNAQALEHIEIALMYMNKRVMDRYERNVLGTYNK